MVLVVLLASSWPPPALAGGKGDHERARAALQAGEVLPLRTLLERVERSHPGQVLEVELERDDGRWIYELKLLQAGGRLLKLKLDARTAEPLQSKTPDAAKDSRKDERTRRADDRR